MPAAQGTPVSPQVFRVLAGLEAGILGGLAMAGWILLAAALGRRSLWLVPNLVSSLVYGRAVLHGSFGWTSLAGLALQLFAAGVIGMVFGVLVGDSRNRLRVTLLGILSGLVWYYFSQSLLWNRLGVTAAFYSSPRSLLLGHILFGVVLGAYPGRLQALGARLRVPAAAPPALPPGGPPTGMLE